MSRLTCIPRSDNDARDWMSRVINIAGEHLEELKMSGTQISDLSTVRMDFGDKLGEHMMAQAAAKGATARKNESREAAETLFVNIFKPIIADPTIPESLKEQMGLRAVSAVSDPEVVTSVPYGEDTPELYVESRLGQNIIHWGMNPQKKRNPKPSWVKMCLIYRKRGNEADYNLISSSTKSPFTDVITGSADDYSYVARYKGKNDSEIGPQSATFTVAGRGELPQAA